jgi:hypothetical protein
MDQVSKPASRSELVDKAVDAGDAAECLRK